MRESYGIYSVTGRRSYRGHKPGDTFEARLEPEAEYRAVRRGDITLLKRVELTLLEGSFALPKDWPPSEANGKETPVGVLTAREESR